MRIICFTQQRTGHRVARREAQDVDFFVIDLRQRMVGE